MREQERTKRQGGKGKKKYEQNEGKQRKKARKKFQEWE